MITRRRATIIECMFDAETVVLSEQDESAEDELDDPSPRDGRADVEVEAHLAGVPFN